VKYSVVVPVYRNEASLGRLVDALRGLHRELGGDMEAVLVVDGSPDGSYRILRDQLEGMGFPARLIAHSRNFGSFAAIRTGMRFARGEYAAVLSADLQEPPELLLRFFAALSADECDVAVGARDRRDDPFLSGLASRLFWRLYRALVVPEIPAGGVDVFACNRAFREHLLQLEESRSSLVALIFWLGFRRKEFTYDRLERQEGKSAWSLRKKLDYMNDSIFAFTDLPVRWLTRLGAAGLAVSLVLGGVVLAARLMGFITVPGYTMTVLVVIFFGTLNMLGLGIVGAYAWRAYENSKRRPQALVAAEFDNFSEGAP
jgi:glycosyltransferase involved in cell wall biosynthesis